VDTHSYTVVIVKRVQMNSMQRATVIQSISIHNDTFNRLGSLESDKYILLGFENKTLCTNKEFD
jgi:hypothetical protein